MRPSFAIALGFCASAACVAGGAARASIVLELTSTAKVEGETLELRLEVVNGGDEPAHSLLPVLSFGDEVDRGEAQATLRPGDTLSRELSVPFGGGQGRWPVVLTVDYADANGYLLQALQVSAVQAGQPPAGGLRVSALQASELAERGTVSISLHNMTAESRVADLRIFAPRGIEVAAPTLPVSLDGWAEKSVSFSLVNRSALPGSRLPIFAVLEWMESEAHQTAIGSGLIAIVERRPVLDRYRVLALVGLALVLLSGAVYWLQRRERRRLPPGDG